MEWRRRVPAAETVASTGTRQPASLLPEDLFNMREIFGSDLNLRKRLSRATGPAVRLGVWMALSAAAVWSAPPLTPVQDVLYKADGTPFVGTAEVSWRTFTASDGSAIAQNVVLVPVVSGVLRVKLVPTTTASGAASYTVRYNANGKIQFTETWAVPPSSVPLAIKNVRVDTPVGGVVQPPPILQMTDIPGLSDALSARPAKGAQFTSSRLAWIDVNGELSGITGTGSDCVHVDGSTAPCSDNPTRFFDLETPSGVVNGVATAFQTSQIPNPVGSLHFFRNGILQKVGVDFVISGNQITFINGVVPQAGDVLAATYRTGGR